ncbi:MAG: hypothetical protein ACRENG_28545, partial [bacterium]
MSFRIPQWLIRGYEIFDRWTTPLQPSDANSPTIPFELGAIGSFRRDPETGDWSKYKFDPTPAEPERWTKVPNAPISPKDKDELDGIEREIVERGARREKLLDDFIRHTLPLSNDRARSGIEEICRNPNFPRNPPPTYRIVYVDPLAIDLDGDGIETAGINGASTVLFDHNADGLKTGTGWLKGDDAWLVRDLNGNGTIDSGAEMFGDQTLLPNGQKAASGLQALRALDSNS